MSDEDKGSNPKTETKPGVAKGPFDWRVVLIAIYLFVLLLVSFNWLSGLMMANTTGLDDNGKKIAACNANLGSGCAAPAVPPVASGNNDSTNGTAANITPAPSPTSNLSTATNANSTNSNRPVNANSNTRPTGESVSNVNGPANRPISDPKSPVSGANTNSNTAIPRPSDVADYVVVKNPGFFGSWLSVCEFCESGCISGDGFLFLLVLFAGMIGATVRSLTYLGWYVGNGRFAISWVWYYLFQPFFGAALSLIFYVVLRGGFGSGTIGKNNLYAFAAVAFLCGLFTENVMRKLKVVAESILGTVEKPKPAKPGDGGNQPVDPAGGGNKPAGTAAPPRNIGKDEPPI